MKKTIQAILIASLFVLSANRLLADHPVNSGEGIQPYDAGPSYSSDWNNPAYRLPYAIMSYFAEVTKIEGRSPKKQKALDQRMKYLAGQGYVPIREGKIPKVWQEYYEGDDLQRIYIDKSGFRARIYINENKRVVVLAISGTDFSDKDSVASALYLAYGYKSNALINGIDLAQSLQDDFKGYQLEITGASQGGAIAQLASVATGATAYVFNSQAPHRTLFSGIDETRKSLIKHAYIEGDMLNDSIHYTSILVQNSSTVETLEITVSDEMEDRINSTYYRQHGAMYYMTSNAWVRHWTGTVLDVSEQLAGKKFDDLYPRR